MTGKGKDDNPEQLDTMFLLIYHSLCAILSDRASWIECSTVYEVV